MKNEIKQLIEKLNLAPHPEGGYFKETYRAYEQIPVESLGDNYSGDRNVATCIYFLLTSDNFSAFHKINQDEIWHFYSGSPILLHIISEKGLYESHQIGSNILNSEVPQFVVPGGSWFAAEVIDNNSYSLIGCTVSPGFHFDDFHLANREMLLQKFPEHAIIIQRLTRVN